MAGSFTVRGYGGTTNTAYQDALSAKVGLTQGDERTWVVVDQRYAFESGFSPDKSVVCELTLELVESFA